jgi:3-methyladenine DNA glycosylase AlkD
VVWLSNEIEILAALFEENRNEENAGRLRRSAILFQLKYKQETNEDLLYDYIVKNAESKEFFIQKAIGWALREYSKTNPVSVKAFIEGNELAPLSVREGSKYLL